LTPNYRYRPGHLTDPTICEQTYSNFQGRLKKLKIDRQSSQTENTLLFKENILKLFCDEKNDASGSISCMCVY